MTQSSASATRRRRSCPLVCIISSSSAANGNVNGGGAIISNFSLFVGLLVLLLVLPVDAESVTSTTFTSILRAGGTGGGNGGGNGGGTGGGTGVSSSTTTTEAPTSPSPSPSNASSNSSTQDRGLGWFNLLKQLEDGEVELRALRGGSNWDLFCDGAPVVVTKSLSVSANNACYEFWTNLSCTCLSDLKSPSSVWDFRVTKRDVQPTGLVAPIPTTGTSTAVQVSTIGAFTIPAELTTLKLVGDSATPLDVRWDFKLLWGQLSASVLVISRDPASSLLTSVQVANLSLAGIDITTDFLPAKLAAISLQNCNISTLGGDFLTKHHPTLERLVLADNSLTAFESAVSNGSALTELDLSNNKFTSIPDSIFQLNNLKKLYLHGNPISDFSVTSSQFLQVSKLSTFQIDAAADIPSLKCTGGKWQSVGNIKLCVVSDPTTLSVTSESSNMLYVGVGVPACVLVFAIIALVLRRRRLLVWSGSKRSSSAVSLLESTGSQDFSMVIVDNALLNDPLILMNRIPYREIVVRECVNRGGFGIVYSGEYKDRKVAIKKIRSEFNTDIMRIEAFLREICLVASLDHPRIVEFIGVAWDSLPNIAVVTEFMEQGDLREVLQSYKKSKRRLTWDSHKTRIALHIVEALAYLHSLVPTVIHRDLKSKNVLLNSDLDAKLSDFGISREWTADDTHMTVGIGTSFWIAPEVLLGKKYDERADIFSFGVVLSELDTDDYPYWNAVNGAEANLNENAILRLVAVGQVQPSFTTDCPRAILELAELCLQSDFQRRPTSAQVVNVLRHLLAHGTDSSYPSSSQMSNGSISSDSLY